MNVTIADNWKQRLADEFTKPYFTNLAEFVRTAYLSATIYPKPKDVFRAFDLTPFENVRVVIVGQDPYHGPHQANGLSFAVHDDVAIPPSLRNIFKEISAEFGAPQPKNGDLSRWAKQGVLLLNATLTVAAGMAASHQGKGWEEFTDAVLKKVSEEREHVVFLLWGAYARKKGAFIDRSKHLILESAHPSPLSAHNGFLGNGHFKKANEYLVANGLQPIDWVGE